MKIKNDVQLERFLDAVDRAKYSVYLMYPGDNSVFDLKSSFSRYLAVAQLIGDKGDELEVFCRSKEDEQLFYGLLEDFPEVR